MSTYEEAVAAKEKFKEQFWSKDPEKYNAIVIGSDLDFSGLNDDDSDENIEIDEDFFIKVFLFDIKDAEGLPANIDGVEIKYLPVIEKELNARKH